MINSMLLAKQLPGTPSKVERFTELFHRRDFAFTLLHFEKIRLTGNALFPAGSPQSTPELSALGKRLQSSHLVMTLHGPTRAKFLQFTVS